MSATILATKLFVPPPRPKVVLRPRLIERLDEGLHRRLTLVSAPAGFGKSTLLGEWIAGCGQQVAWLSLDEGDSGPARCPAPPPRPASVKARCWANGSPVAGSRSPGCRWTRGIAPPRAFCLPS